MSIVNRVIAAVVAVAAMAAAAGVVVVAAAFAIYTLLRDRFGPAAAAAIIAAAFAVALALAALVMFRKAKPQTAAKQTGRDRPSATTDRIMEMLTERPIVAAAAAAAAGLLAWRNPTLVSTILAALDLKSGRRPTRR